MVLLVGSERQVYKGTALMTPTGTTKQNLIKKKGEIKSKARSAAAKKNPGLTRWRQAITIYKKTAGIPATEFFLTPKHGTKAYKDVSAIYDRLKK
jgi:hypothetical protein